MKKQDFKNYDQKPTEDFSIPSAGIEDIDRALFNLFDKDIPLEVKINGTYKKVPVVFAAGERFALTRRKNPIRDNNNTLILPLISITRGNIDFSPGQSGRGSAVTIRDQNDYVVKKRLAKSDRKYQNMINKIGLANQDNVSSKGKFISEGIYPGTDAMPGTIATRRQTRALSISKAGKMLVANPEMSLGKNIFEIIQVPYPVFIAIEYDIVIWAQYMTQMNQMQETFLASAPGQAEEFVLKTDKGYEYVASFDTTFNTDTNFSEFTEEERIIKTNFSMTVPGYIINPQHPGLPSQVRSFYSAPQIEFIYHDSNSHIVRREKTESRDQDKFILNDLKTVDQIKERDQRGQSSEEIYQEILNPFTGESSPQFSKILTRNNRSGETVASTLIVKKTETQYE